MRISDNDELTGLPQKGHFDEAVVELINGSTDTAVSLAFFDVDAFLKVNEKYGHEKGDEVLAQIALLFSRYFADGDAQSFRIGGDEFSVLLPGTEKERAFLQLEQVRSQIAELSDLTSIEPHPTISIGIATFPDDGATRQEIIRKADDALFRAKSMGRNRVILAREEKKVPKTSHYTQGQLERLTALSAQEGVGEAELLREALDDLLKKYSS